MSDTLIREDFATRSQKVHQFAQNLFKSNPDWVTFFREVLGVAGAARKLFPRQDEYLAFENSEEFKRVQLMVAALRNRKGSGINVDEPTKVITVRLPESLHEALKAEADNHGTSMNKLCISKLLQVLSQMNQRPVTPVRPASTPIAPPTPVPSPTPTSAFQRPHPSANPHPAPSQPIHQQSQRFGNSNPGMR